VAQKTRGPLILIMIVPVVLTAVALERTSAAAC
jgi:hypothetical protein